jgi:hypothetical protein
MIRTPVRNGLSQVHDQRLKSQPSTVIAAVAPLQFQFKIDEPSEHLYGTRSADSFEPRLGFGYIKSIEAGSL